MARSSASFKPGHVGGGALTGGNPQWRKGQSGNPSGKSNTRRLLEIGFADALQGILQPSELAEMLVTAGRKGDAFALSLLATYYLPSMKQKEAVDKEAAENAIAFDFTVLTPEQRTQLQGLLNLCRKKST